MQYGYGYNYPPPRQGMGAAGLMTAAVMMGSLLAMEAMMLSCMKRGYQRPGPSNYYHRSLRREHREENLEHR